MARSVVVIRASHQASTVPAGAGGLEGCGEPGDIGEPGETGETGDGGVSGNIGGRIAAPPRAWASPPGAAYLVRMAPRSLASAAPVLLALVSLGCRGAPRRVLLDTSRARVTALVDLDGDRWRVHDIEAAARPPAALLSLRVSAFLDGNANGLLDAGEERGSWSSESGVPVKTLAQIGQLKEASLDPERLGSGHLETRVGYAQGPEDRAVSAFE